MQRCCSLLDTYRPTLMLPHLAAVTQWDRSTDTCPLHRLTLARSRCRVATVLWGSRSSARCSCYSLYCPSHSLSAVDYSIGPIHSRILRSISDCFMLSKMRAALVHAFDKPPSFGSFAPPTAAGSDVLITVKAAAVSPVVRLSASGLLYVAGSPLPFIPGVDGVGHIAGKPSSRVYFAFPTAPYGALAETVAIPRALTIPIPDGLSDIDAAALANPAMSSWVALTRRTKLQRGETVLVNGATGAAGRLAVQIAKHLGAGRIIATGRNKQRLEEVKALGASELIVLDGSKEEMVARFKAAIQSGVDVVLDYLWGASAEQIVTACINAGSRTDKARRIRFINIGQSSGPSVNIAAIPFRSSALEVLGSGLGSEPNSELMASIDEALRAALEAGFKVDTWTAPIEDVEKAWTAQEHDKRLVVTL